MNILLFDNYDSFTYNLLHYVEKISDANVEVYRNNEITIDEIERFDRIILSPGPGLPKDAGILMEVIKKYSATKSILGVCLGQQAIAEAFGGSLINLKEVYHGVAMPVSIIKDDLLFENIPKIIKVGRYHSWVVNKSDLPNELEIIAEDELGNIMALRHKTLNIKAVQFHPESILSEYGLAIIDNWVNRVSY